VHYRVHKSPSLTLNCLSHPTIYLRGLFNIIFQATSVPSKRPLAKQAGSRDNGSVCIWKVLGSNLSLGVHYPDWDPTASSSKCPLIYYPHTNHRINSGLYNLRGRSPWPRGLRRRSAADRLLGSSVRIPKGTWMFVSCECLCCQVEVSVADRSLVQRSPTECGVCLCVIKCKINNLDTCCEQVGRRGKDCETKR
jgi:hypothetical protein